MNVSSQHLISSICRTCLRQLPCESSYNLFATPDLAKKLSVCTSLSVEQQDGFPDNICDVCYTRLNEMHDFQEQCVDAVLKFQDMVRLIGPNEMKAHSCFGKSYNEQQDTNGVKNETLNDCGNINSENLMIKIKECEQVVLGGVDKIEIEETQIQENFNKKGVKPQYQETTHTEGKKYECDTCDKKFTTSKNLKRHKEIHTQEKPYVCKTCGKQFSRPQYLSRHEIIHTGEKPHKCEICDKKFTQATNLRHHKTIHTGEKPHKCEICYKNFTQASTLKRHKVIHMVEKPYGCEICGKKFSLPVKLKLHEVKHSEERHTCKTCGKSYKKHHDLRYHEVTHTGNSFACKTCGKNFPRRDYLTFHERRRHSMDKPFKCDICFKGFCTGYELKSHKRSKKKCMNVTCSEFEVSDKSKLKNKMENDSPVSSDMDEQEFISISSK